jgi:hypothetical protein
METTEETGPVDVVVIAYPPGARMSGEAAPLLKDLVDRGVVRILDMLFVRREADGTVSGFTGQGLGEHDVGDLSEFEASSPGMLQDADVAEAAEAVDPGGAATIIVYENVWVAPFASAVRRNGGELVAFQRIMREAPPTTRPTSTPTTVTR